MSSADVSAAGAPDAARTRPAYTVTMLGTLSAGLVTDRLARRNRMWLLLVPGLSTLLTVPFVVGFLTLKSPLAPAMCFGAGLFGPAMLGPVMAATQSIAAIRMRALATAIVGISLNLVGTGLGLSP
jgi:sugar phosphate permease